MKYFSQLTVIGLGLALGACSGQSEPEKTVEEVFVELCTPVIQEAQEAGLAEAEMFCGCAGDVFKEHATAEEFATINAIFKDVGPDSRIEKELRTKLGEERYREIGDHIDKCDT